MKLKIFRVFSIIILATFMLLIYNLSAETAAESSKTSGGFSKMLLSLIYPDFDILSAEKQLELISGISFFIRKTAHFTLYGMIGFWAQMSVISYRKISFLARNLIACAIALAYAAFDEWHQTFVNGRSGELRDIFIDFLGALTFICLSAVVMRCIKRIYRLVKTIN